MFDPIGKAIDATLVAFKCEGGADPAASFLELSRRNPRGFGATLGSELKRAFTNARKSAEDDGGPI
jgi:hypothetical protein